MLGNRIPTKTVYSAGMIALVLSSLLQLVARHYPQAHPDLMDGLRGVCLGIFFGAMALKIWRHGRPAV
jgi:hypothetical protein